MHSLMKTDFVAESYEEKLLCNRLEQMRESKEIKVFIKKIEEVVNKDIKIFAYRIKKKESAIRTFKISNYSTINEMYDLLGFLFVVEDEEHIAKLVKKLKKKLKNRDFEEYNLLKEKPYNNINLEVKIKNEEYKDLVNKSFNNLIYMPSNLDLVLPPFSYNLLVKMNFKDLDFNVPIEIRIQTKEGFIVTESYYYTVHKNDTIQLDVKISLINIGFRILKRMTEIEFTEDFKEKEEKVKQIQNIIKNNKEFINNNKDIINIIMKENKDIINNWKNKRQIYEFNII